MTNFVANDNIITKVNDTLSSLTTDLITLGNTIGIIAIVVCCVMLLTSSDPGTVKSCKKWAFSIGIAIIVLNSANAVADYIKTISLS